MIIIEAKAVAEFHPDQNDSFAQDIAEVRRLTGLSSVHLVGLCSSKYYAVDQQSASLFEAMLRWDELAAHYADLFGAIALACEKERGPAPRGSR